MSKKDHIHMYQGLGFQYIFWGDTIQPTLELQLRAVTTEIYTV
jgi:hypothetical protein